MASEGGEWVPVASMSAERGSLAVAAINGQIIACGGGIPGTQHDLVETCALLHLWCLSARLAPSFASCCKLADVIWFF